MLEVMLLLTTRRPPALPVLANPIQQRPLETDIVTQALRLEPLVLQDFFPLGEKLLIKTGLFHKLSGRRRLLSRMSHEAGQNESEAARPVNARNFS